jgi:recombinational DNA repair protein (RecF pathway)
MPNEGTNPGVPADSLALRLCARCGRRKPPAAFYRNPASICKDCHNRASRAAHDCRRAALAQLVARHPKEYQELLRAERTKRACRAAGGGADAA